MSMFTRNFHVHSYRDKCDDLMTHDHRRQDAVQ